VTRSGRTHAPIPARRPLRLRRLDDAGGRIGDVAVKSRRTRSVQPPLRGSFASLEPYAL